MEQDKQIELLNDLEEEGGSDCCGARVYMDICSDCKEHCGISKDEEEEKVEMKNGEVVTKEEYAKIRETINSLNK